MLLNHDHSRTTYIIGAGMFAREVDSVLKKHKVEDIRCVDYDQFDLVPAGSQCYMGFSNVEYRARFFAEHNVDQHFWPSYVNDHAVIEDLDSIGRGCWIWPFCYIGFECTLGDFSIMGGRSDLGHAVHTGRNNYLGPAVILTGRIHTGDNVFFGAMSCVGHCVNIAGNSSFLMHSVVHKNIDQPGRYYGNRLAHDAKNIQAR